MKMKNLSYLLIPALGFAASVSLASPNLPIAPRFANQSMILTVTNSTTCPLTLVTPGDGRGNACTITHQGTTVAPNMIVARTTATITCTPGTSMDLWYNHNSTTGSQKASLQFNHIVTPSYSYFLQGNDWGAGVSYSVNGSTLDGVLSDDGQGNDHIIQNNTIKLTVDGGNKDACLKH